MFTFAKSIIRMRKLKNNELNRLNLEEFKNTSKTPLVIVLDNVRSAHNVGSVFRTSDAFIISKIFLCGITPTPPHKEIRKTALGARILSAGNNTTIPLIASKNSNQRAITSSVSNRQKKAQSSIILSHQKKSIMLSF